mmetsp:Transcript_87032/g.173829  ORF Transcript_87032/g.173829 Transcript_87032/m.173829 type:complete len:222 (-) Transcript_87032:40-705(-)
MWCLEQLCRKDLTCLRMWCLEQPRRKNLQNHPPAEVRHILLGEVKDAVAREVVGRAGHEDAAIRSVLLSRHVFLERDVRPVGGVIRDLLLIIRFVGQPSAQVGKNHALTAEERIIILKTLEFEVDDGKRPMVSMAVDGNNDQLLLEDVDLLGPSLHAFVVIRATATRELRVEIRLAKVAARRLRERVCQAGCLGRDSIFLTDVQQLEEEVDHLVVEPAAWP